MATDVDYPSDMIPALGLGLSTGPLNKRDYLALSFYTQAKSSHLQYTFGMGINEKVMEQIMCEAFRMADAFISASLATQPETPDA